MLLPDGVVTRDSIALFEWVRDFSNDKFTLVCLFLLGQHKSQISFSYSMVPYKREDPNKRGGGGLCVRLLTVLL